MIEFLRDGDPAAAVHILLAHGAGAPMTSPFMSSITAGLATEGLHVRRFEFGYMAARRLTGKRSPPPRADRLTEEFMAAVHVVAAELPRTACLLIGGKSMGGRVASLVADELHAAGYAAGLVCLGYPFHPPGKPDAPRTAHLASLRCPALIVQGERDPFGSRMEVEAMVAGGALSCAIRLWWARDGDHDLGPRGRSGATRSDNLEQAAAEVARFARSMSGEPGAQ